MKKLMVRLMFACVGGLISGWSSLYADQSGGTSKSGQGLIQENLGVRLSPPTGAYFVTQADAVINLFLKTNTRLSRVSVLVNGQDVTGSLYSLARFVDSPSDGVERVATDAMVITVPPLAVAAGTYDIVAQIATINGDIFQDEVVYTFVDATPSMGQPVGWPCVEPAVLISCPAN